MSLITTGPAPGTVEPAGGPDRGTENSSALLIRMMVNLGRESLIEKSRGEFRKMGIGKLEIKRHDRPWEKNRDNSFEEGRKEKQGSMNYGRSFPRRREVLSEERNRLKKYPKWVGGC